MKEIIIQIPEESKKLVEELVLRLGGSIEIEEKEDLDKNETSEKDLKSKTSTIPTKMKDNPLALFGKYPDFPLDPNTYRNDLWKREAEL